MRLGITDRAWLLMDSANTPMHVGGLATFALPDGAGDDFVGDLVAHLRRQTEMADPWTWRLPGLFPSALAPGWVREPNVDLDYHLRHSALPHPRGERELGVLVSRLHSHPLDLERPPWEIHVIEGLSDGRFGVYMKIHHAMIDGVSAMRLLLRMTAPSPDGDLSAPWTVPWAAGGRATTVPTGHLERVAGTAARSTRAAARLLIDVVGRPQSFVPSLAPRSMLELPMNQQRRFATQSIPLDAVRSTAARHGATVNDVVLQLCGGALRRFLLESGDLPDDASLVAAVPMSLRAEDDDRVGTRIAMLSLPLGTHLADPFERLQHIAAASARAKAEARRLGPEAQVARMAVTAAPVGISQVLPRWPQVRQSFNLGMSNVHGPKEPVYLAGARMLGLYPASLLMHGGALNITCVSYDGHLDFGFTGARDVLPHLQRLAVYLGEEAARLLTTAQAR